MFKDSEMLLNLISTHIQDNSNKIHDLKNELEISNQNSLDIQKLNDELQSKLFKQEDLSLTKQAGLEHDIKSLKKRLGDAEQRNQRMDQILNDLNIKKK